MEIFGNFERLIDDLYSYRWPIAGLLITSFIAAIFLAIRLGVPGKLRRHPVASVLAFAAVLVIALPVGNYTLSPLWTRTTLIEESPLVASTNSEPETSSPTTFGTATPATTPARQITPDLEETPSPIRMTPSPERQMTPDAPATSTIPPPTPEPTATPTPTFEPHIVRAGALSGADDFHFAQGDAFLIESAPGTFVLRLENVSVRNGPDLFVYLSPSIEGIVDGAVNLGGLKATDGSFNYEIPAEFDVNAFEGVVIWCRAFAVLFGTAPLA